MTKLVELFPGFDTHRINAQGAEIFVRSGGNGPPLLLLHGYPQTHACWHKITPQLQKHFTVYLIDLRGYGLSKATDIKEHSWSYSKRAMAEDCIDVMQQLGHQKFAVLSHDRGARVGYRLALDHPQAISKLVTLDIVPTSEAWDAMDYDGAVSKFHWSLLAQPYPMPEQLIGAAPDVWHQHLLQSWNAEGDLSCFDEHALARYLEACSRPECIHAMCEDYRAGLGIDAELDRADQSAGRRITCPTLVLWGQKRSLGTVSNTLEVWQRWCNDVRGAPILSGHFLAEENPADTLEAVLPFLGD